MKGPKRIHAGLVCLCALTLTAAQISPSPHAKVIATERQQRWLNVGAGGGSVRGGLGENDGGIAVGASYSFRRGPTLISARFVVTEEFKLDIFGYTGPPDAVWDCGLLYGGIAKASAGFASIAGGLSLMGWSRNHRSSLCLGVPFEAQVFCTPTSVVGFGFYGYADVNREKSFAGLLFCVQIGRLR